MINLQTEVGTRISLMSMTGTFEGTREIERTAKNYCDGSSTIKLSPLVVGLVRWDEYPQGVVTISQEDMKHVSRI